ncbi:MAG: DUF2249 domain-containing protein [Burkholderiales bacterium]|nr:DUF2249 domain-containing protein [Burkholderiales bacterium]
MPDATGPLPQVEPRTLDVRFLEPPEPFERIVEALAALPEGEVLRVLIHREPRPLFNWLREDGFRWRGEWGSEGYEILIWR